jgi:hypothetical protein
LAAILLAPAAMAQAQSGNGGATAPRDDLAAVPSPVGGAAPAPASPSPAASGPNTLSPPPAMVGSVALIRGRLTAADAGRPVVLGTFDGRRWVAAGSARADQSGGFVVPWRAQHLGRFLMRASRNAKFGSGPTAQVEVYRSVIATWFGPGSYGSRTACGQILTPELVGLAHRTLPCGTIVDIAYGNQTMSLPVVDRGPYADGVSYDLTAGAAQALGVSDTIRIGAVAIRGGAPISP